MLRDFLVGAFGEPVDPRTHSERVRIGNGHLAMVLLRVSPCRVAHHGDYALPGMSSTDESTSCRKIIIDTDPGIDDAMAIFYALSSPRLQVLALTTVFGNCHTTISTINALRILDIAGRPDVTVAHGAEAPLVGAYEGPADIVHGADGQGNVNLEPSSRQPIDLSAAQLIVQLVNEHPGEITLVPLGPLTNIALALRIDPQLASKLAGIVLMGGNAFCSGNATAGAEANIFNDPEAADIVFGAACPVVMVGLDVTHKVVMGSMHVARIGDIDTPQARHLSVILPYYVNFHEFVSGTAELIIHDSTVITYLLAPELFVAVDLPVRVDCGHGVSRGKTLACEPWVKHDANFHGRPNVHILTGVDSEAAIELELAHLKR